MICAVCPQIVHYQELLFLLVCCVYVNSIFKRLLSVGRFGAGRGSVFRYSLYSMGSLRGEAPHNSRVVGSGRRAAALPPGNVGRSGGDAVPPSKINYLMSVSVRFGICFGSVGLALKPYMKPTLHGDSSNDQG